MVNVTARRLLLSGMLMPVIYLAMFVLAASLTPDFHWRVDEPSQLGIASAPYRLLYDTGMIATAAAGMLAAAGLFHGLRRTRGGIVLAGATAAALLLASAGIAMAGLFPLPSPFHYGFGLTTAGILVPAFGAFALLRTAGGRRDALRLALILALIVALVVRGAPPLLVGLAMFAAIAYLCLAVRTRL